MLLNYQSTDGASGQTPSEWPSNSQVALDQSHPTLIMFAHPKCPCTRASVEELNRLMGQCQGKVAAHVFIFKPAEFPDDWTQTGLWPSAAAIPGVKVQEDHEGAEARRFGAETSGYLVLYDPRGHLLFRGGITDGRGHVGDNAGEKAVLAFLTGQTAHLTQAPVYGCSLLGYCTAPPASTK